MERRRESMSALTVAVWLVESKAEWMDALRVSQVADWLASWMAS